MNIIIALLLLSASDSLAKSYEDQDTFFVDLEKKLADEYRTCTNDSTKIKLDSLIRWKKNMTVRTETSEYKKILEEFISHTGMVFGALPCEVFAWQRDRKNYLKTGEDTVVRKLLAKSDHTVDSIRVYRELKANPPSSFDFDSIPFGLTKKVFALVFHNRFSFPLPGKGDYLFTEHFYIKGTPFLIKFYFSNTGKYYKYEIEGYAFPGDSLNTIVRPQAIMLKQIMEEKIGPPDRLYRIGYFDIKSQTLSTYVKWEKETHSAYIGIGLEKIRYYTRATVICKKLVP